MHNCTHVRSSYPIGYASVCVCVRLMEHIIRWVENAIICGMIHAAWNYIHTSMIWICIDNRPHRLFVWKNWTTNSFAVVFDGMLLLQWNCRSFNVNGIVRIFHCVLHAEPLFIANGERRNMPHLYDARPDNQYLEKKKWAQECDPSEVYKNAWKTGFIFSLIFYQTVCRFSWFRKPTDFELILVIKKKALPWREFLTLGMEFRNNCNILLLLVSWCNWGSALFHGTLSMIKLNKITISSE